MLLFQRTITQAAQNEALGDATRYAAQRWAELLDEHTHFSQSASSIIVPTVLLRELREEIHSFVTDKRAHFSNILECFKQARDTLRQEPNIGAWFPTERMALLTAVAAIDPIPPSVAPEYWVTQKAQAVAANELPALAAVVDDPQTGYRARLLDAVEAALRNGVDAASGWRVFDENLSNLAAIALSEGRGGRHLALAAADAWADVASDDDAATRFRALLESTAETYVVAVCVEGTNAIKKLDSFGCVAIGNPAAWPGGNHGGTGTRLRQFLATRLDGRRRACGLFIEVDALDPEHARASALAAIELLHDHIAAEHRIARFDVDPEVLVLHEPTRAITRIGGEERTVEEARPLGGRRLPSLQRALRFHKLARAEEASVVAVVQSWIAMENLANNAQAYLQRGGRRRWIRQSPAGFLPQHVAAVVYLAAARNQLISAWHLIRRGCGGGSESARFQELARWLGVLASRRWFVDLDRWLALLQANPAAVAPNPLPLTATPSQARAVLRELLVGAPPYIRVRIDEASAMARSPARLSEWSTRVEQRAQANVSRLRMLRNRIVHGAMPEHDSATQVATAGRHLLDALFEVVPHWLGPNVPVWRALYNARIWQTGLRKRWRAPGAQLGTGVDAIIRGPKMGRGTP